MRDALSYGPGGHLYGLKGIVIIILLLSFIFLIWFENNLVSSPAFQAVKTELL